MWSIQKRKGPHVAGERGCEGVTGVMLVHFYVRRSHAEVRKPALPDSRDRICSDPGEHRYALETKPSKYGQSDCKPPDTVSPDRN